MPFSLDHTVFFGRTWEESTGMYGLTEEEMRGKRILDCPGGPDAMVIEGATRGLDIVAVDPNYSQTPEKLEALGLKEISETMISFQQDPKLAADQKQADAYEKLKLKALQLFIKAFRLYPERFITGTLPSLPFEDNAFDLSLSGHLLFVYSSVEQGGLMSHDEFDLDFHIAAVRELVRVSHQVRIFPTWSVNKPPRRQAYVEPVMKAMAAEGHDVRLLPSQWVEMEYKEFNDFVCITKAS